MFETTFKFSVGTKVEDREIWESVASSIKEMNGVSSVTYSESGARIADLQVLISTPGRDEARRLHDQIMQKLSRNRSISILGIEYDLRKMSGKE